MTSHGSAAPTFGRARLSLIASHKRPNTVWLVSRSESSSIFVQKRLAAGIHRYAPAKPLRLLNNSVIPP